MKLYGIELPRTPEDNLKRANVSWDHINNMRKLGYAAVMHGDGFRSDDPRKNRLPADIMFEPEGQ